MPVLCSIIALVCRVNLGAEIIRLATGGFEGARLVKKGSIRDGKLGRPRLRVAASGVG